MKKNEWLENGSISFAGDLITTGISLGEKEEVRDAAEFVLRAKGTHTGSLVKVAEHVLGIQHDYLQDLPEICLDSEIDVLGQRIHDIRRRLHDEPRNAFLWVNLARLYTTLGLPSQATNAIEIALCLAPLNRFVVRSAARLFIHQDEYRRAHDLLRNNDRVKHDPWLLGAEIAVAGTAGRTSRLIKTGRQMVEENKYEPWHLSELASALSTLDFEAARSKDGRKHLAASLLAPTENAVAQAAWIARQHFHVILPLLGDNWPTSHEAQAWEYCRKAKWTASMDEAKLWLCDQPFSSRPATLGSYIAAVDLGDFEESARIAKRGLVANPTDFTLLNNFVFARAQQNQISEARSEFNRVRPSTLSDEETFVWLATSGLLAYREGNPDEGRALYLKAIEQGRKVTDEKRQISAFLWFALEESRIHSAEAPRYRQEALEGAKHNRFPDVAPLIRRVAEYK